MTWREKLTCRILILLAKIVASERNPNVMAQLDSLWTTISGGEQP